MKDHTLNIEKTMKAIEKQLSQLNQKEPLSDGGVGLAQHEHAPNEKHGEILGLFEELRDHLIGKEKLISRQTALLLEKDQVISCKDQVISKKDQIISTKDHIISTKDQLLSVQAEKIAHLTAQLHAYLYGKKSEKSKHQDELSIADEAALSEQQLFERMGQKDKIKAPRRAKGSPKRKPIPAGIPRVSQIIDLPENSKACKGCGGLMACCGQETSERLDIIPAKIRVIQTVRKKYSCRSCGDVVVTAANPGRFLPKSLATESMLAHVAAAKYEYHLPLYRQQRMFEALDIDIQRSTLCGWMMQCAEKLQCLADVMRQEILNSGYARADETPVRILKKGKVHTSQNAYMWVFATGRSERPVVLYQFNTSRQGSHAERFFEGFQGHLQVDGYQGYAKTTAQPGITLVGCWAHARRKFYEITRAGTEKGLAHEAVETIAKLYQIETHIKDHQYGADQAHAHRELHARPILKEFKGWLEKHRSQVPPKGPLGKAIAYTLERWEALTEYLSYGYLDIDNNAAERCIRPFAVGRKNWLFVGSEEGGEAAAIFFTLIGTAKLNGLNVQQYLRHLMLRLPHIEKTDDNLRALLPNHLRPEDLEPYFLEDPPIATA